VVEPVVAVLIDDKQVRLSGFGLGIEVAAALVACAGIALLATSPLVLSIYVEERLRARRDT